MAKEHSITPEHTAVRTALWRALHVLLDEKPYVFTDEIGAQIVGEENWRNRPDMGADFSKSMRASIVGRARLIEDLVEECFSRGVNQYVILGAGLDTFAFRRREIASQMQVFEVDQPGPQLWKRNRLVELGLDVPSGLYFVPVDFESGQSWWDELIKAGLDKNKPAIIGSTGVSMYLSKEANMETLKQVAGFAPKSTFAMTLMLSLDLLESKEKSIMEFVMNKAEESGTPFLSLFNPEDIVTLARNAGFKDAKYVSARNIFERYFAKRTDGLNAGNAEAFLVAST